jgi:hypothetical protein
MDQKLCYYDCGDGVPVARSHLWIKGQMIAGTTHTMLAAVPLKHGNAPATKLQDEMG